MCPPDKLSREPQEGLLKIVVGLRGDIVVLQVFFAVKGYLFRLNLTFFDINLIAHKNNRDILTDTHLVKKARVLSSSGLRIGWHGVIGRVAVAGRGAKTRGGVMREGKGEGNWPPPISLLPWRRRTSCGLMAAPDRGASLGRSCM